MVKVSKDPGRKKSRFYLMVEIIIFIILVAFGLFMIYIL